jgi:hypothetical protein
MRTTTLPLAVAKAPSLTTISVIEGLEMVFVELPEYGMTALKASEIDS